jgi:signal transduction histidine kinase/ligand-binding sensor domain-containing protein
MKKTTLILTLLFTSLQIFNQQTQQIIYDEITVKEGLRGFTDMVQDKKGFIWFGGVWGLQRYDGYEFVNYDQIKDEIYWVYQIIEDSRGILWIDTNVGMYLLNPENEKIVHLDSIGTVLEDKKGTIWCTARNSLSLLKMEPKSKDAAQIKELIFSKGVKSAFTISDFDLITTLNAPDSFYYINGIYQLYEDSQQRLWIGTWQGPGLFIFNRETNECIRIDDDAKGRSRLYHPGVYTIFEENPDVLWVRTYNTFTRISNITQAFSNKGIDKSKLVFDNYLNRMDHEGVFGTTQNMFMLDHQHNFWFGTWDDGLFDLKIDDQKKVTFEELHAKLPELQRDRYKRVTTIMEDCTGLLWVKFDEGIMKFRTTNKAFVPMEGLLKKYNLLSKYTDIFEDDDENLWISTWLDGLFKISKEGRVNNYKIIDPNNPHPLENHINTFLEIEKGLFWVAQLGIWQFNAKTGTCQLLFTKPDELIESDVNDLRKVDNYVLIPTFSQTGPGQGLWLYDLKTHNLKKYTHHQNDTLGLKSNSIISINEMKNGNIWVSTGSRGLSRARLNKATGELIFLPLPEAVTVNKRIILEDSRYIMKIYEDRKGILWFGTATGLIKLNLESGELQKWTEKEGLSNSIISFIEEDNKGNLWVGSEYGLSMLDPVTGRVKNFDKSDGLPYDNVWAPFKNKNGLIYFIGSKGFCSFNPDKIQKNDVIPTVVITDFRLFNKPVQIDSTRKAILTKDIAYTQEIDLTYNQNDLSFTFAALDYNDPSENRYAYMLEGYQKEWIETGADNRIASYTNLNPGKYVFRVKGSNNDGAWNEEGTFINIIIHPPFWKTIWAYIAYGIIILLLLRGFIYWRTRSLRKEKSVLEKEVNKRTEELHEVNTLLEEQNEELMQQKEEIQTTLENLQKTQEQLIESEKMAALGGLVAGVAHEINTPVGIGVTAISNLMEEVQEMAEHYKKDEISRKGFKEFLQSTYDASKLIQKNLERTASLIQSFKQVSVDQISEQQRVFNLKSYFNDIIRSLSPKFKHKNITFNIECDDKLEVDSFPGAYSQIFTNLLLNSFTHGFHEREKGAVNIIANKDNNMLILEYRDDGAGISKKDLPHIFEPFYTSDQHRGTGLGLNIVHNLVKQKLHGSITCESEPGKGVVFMIKLPVTF